jgi:hypothetical protein
VVTKRVKNSSGVYVAGPAISDATVTLVSAGGVSTITDSTGKWHLPISGGPMTLKISAPGYSDTMVVNLMVPTSGVQVDTPLEEKFSALAAAGMTYTTSTTREAGPFSMP